MIKNLVCWCGNHHLMPFSDDYVYCDNCKTLVLREWADEKFFSVEKDEKDFYGKSYWFDHQQKDLGFDNILTRARTDIPERILHWLNTLLKYKLPPGNTLELGCSHGAFVSVLQWAGFQASGLELSPWVVEFASTTFQIPMYQGRLEDQKIEAGSLDAVILMDVLEHLPDPVSTISGATALLKEDGILIIQTPCYPEGHSFETLQKEDDPFLLQFKPPEHLYLFSQLSIQKFLNTCHLQYIQFEPAFFGVYDMFVIASRNPLQINTREAIDQALESAPSGRLVLALLDKDAECKGLVNQLQESESDRAARLEQIHQYDIWLKESQAEVKILQAKQAKLNNSLIYKVGKKIGLF
jgi:2-polyprenyl-3-methyl-5-hydroxy-6-metoxy-1,4-benzoquinol methylase